MDTLTADVSLVRRDRTITTFVVYDAWQELEALDRGQVLELVTDRFEPFESDVAAWCQTVGHRLLACESEPEALHFYIEKGEGLSHEESMAMVISDPGLLELLSPLGFALDDLPVVEYLTFMSIMKTATIQLFA